MSINYECRVEGTDGMSDKVKELEKLVEPLQDWLAENYHPHVKVIVDMGSAEVVEGLLMSVKREQYNYD